MDPEKLDKAIITISKDKLATLPAAVCCTSIRVIDKEDQIPSAIEEIRKAPIIGFDTETRPSFKKGQSYKVALIQLATPEKCFLFRTNIIGIPEPLIDILQDPDLCKVGLSIHDDFHSLSRFTKIDPKGFIDLQSYVKKFKIADNSLSRLYGILFGERISKGQRLSNWEAPELTEAQQAYAALDACACIRIYRFLEEGNFKPEESTYLFFPSEEETAEDNSTQS